MAFTAVIRQDVTIEGGRIVVFPNVITKYQCDYDAISGVFTARKHGIYVFQVNAHSISNKEFCLEIYKNEQYLVSVKGSQNSDYSSAGNSVALDLKFGDRVYLKAHNTAFLYGRDNEIYATFTGFLVENITD